MRTVNMLALNYLRDQRWVLVAMGAYSAVMGTIFALGTGQLVPDDVRFFMDQQLWFALVFSIFLSTSAINSDLRSRRLLVVLSKAVRRWQYLAGILLGVSIVLFVYCVATVGIGAWLAKRSGMPVAPQLLHAELVMLAGLAIACAGLLFGAFLPPLASSLMTFTTLFVPAGLVKISPALAWISPAGLLALAAGDSGFRSLVPLILATVVQGLVAFVIANIVFERRDVATAVE